MIQRPAVFERFVGRDRELEELVSLRSRSAVESRLGCALVAGEAGFGKSRLVHEFRQRTQSERGRYIVVRCFSGWSEPYAAILAALEELRHGERPGSAIETAIEVLRVRDDDAVSPEERARRRREPVAEAIAFEARRRGHLTLVLEDAHWSDIESLAVIRFVIERLSSSAALFVVTYRLAPLEGDFERARAIAALEREADARIVLGPISVRDQLSLLRTSLPSESDEVVERIAELSEGCPFVAEELAFAAVNRGVADLPLSLRATVLERLGELDSIARDVLSRAAVFGRTVRFDDLLVLGSHDRPAILAALRAARDRQILVEDDAGGRPAFRFRHALTREVLYGELLALERADLHRAMAEYIQSGHAAERLSELAYHRWASGDRTPALAACESAGDEARLLGAHGDARRNFSRALECAIDDVDYIRVAEKLLGALRETANYEAVRPLCEAAVRRLERGAGRERALLLSLMGANLLARRFRPREASELFECVVGDFGREGPPEVRFLRLEALVRIEVAYERIGSAQQLFEEVRAVYPEPTPAQEAEISLMRLSTMQLSKHDPTEAIELASLAVERARESDDPRLEARCLLTLSQYQARLDFASAIPTVERAAALSEARHDTAVAWRMRANVAAYLMDVGRVTDSARLLDDAARAGAVGPEWIGAQTGAVRMLGRDPATFIAAMRDPDRFIPTPWHALVVCTNLSYVVSRDEAQRMIAVAWPMIAHPGGMFAVCVARFGDDRQLAALCDAMRDYEPAGSLSIGNFRLYQAHVARRQNRAIAAKNAANEAAAAFAECGYFRGLTEALELAGDVAQAASLLRAAGAVAELARLEGGNLEVTDASIATLSLREQQIARLFCAGATSRETGSQLGIGQRTVETHIAKIYQKLGVRSRSELATALLERERRGDSVKKS